MRDAPSSHPSAFYGILYLPPCLHSIQSVHGFTQFPCILRLDWNLMQIPATSWCLAMLFGVDDKCLCFFFCFKKTPTCNARTYTVWQRLVKSDHMVDFLKESWSLLGTRRRSISFALTSLILLQTFNHRELIQFSNWKRIIVLSLNIWWVNCNNHEFPKIFKLAVYGF